MASWDLASWLVLVRYIQLLGALANGSMNGYLFAFIYTSKLGLSQTMVVLEWMIIAVLIYTALVLLIVHTGNRSKSQSWLVFSIVMDVVFVGIDVGIITVIARAGVPSNCAGLTRSDFLNDDAPNDHGDDYATIRFGDGSSDNKGKLDKYCALERAYYFVAVAILFSYTLTIVLSILRICQDKYTSKKFFYERLDAMRRDTNTFALADKLEESRPFSVAPSPRIPPVAPPSEGITSPRMSIRQPIVSPQSPHHVTQSIPQSIPQNIPLSPPHRTPSFSFASSSRSPPPLVPGIVSDYSEEQAAAAAMITDGARFSGGYQPGMSTLPPYSPTSPTRMSGHGGEHNEIRLSEYVKGETRAQTMKDSGGY